MLFDINSTGWFTKDGRFMERLFQAFSIELPGATFDQNTGKVTFGGGAGQGAQGPQGPQGVQGSVGPQGVPGPTGPQGAAGATGATGALGATGPQGVQGADGTSFDWQGEWDDATAYVTDQVVELGGSTYIALQNSTNEDPSVGQPSNAFWDVFVISGMQGPTGATGPQGAAGATGATGAAGAAGATGATGSTGAQGVAGATGAQGIQGIQGIPGSGINYIQDTDPTLDDPNTVTAHLVWVRLTDPATYAVRNTANTAWVYFSDGGGGGTPSNAIVGPDGTEVVGTDSTAVVGP